MTKSPTRQQLTDLHKLVEKIETTMFTTRRSDGQLVSRPMATQERDPIADLWFVTDVDSQKLDELESDPHVNLAYFDTGSYEWISVSGTAKISTDRAAIRRLHKPDWKAWFGAIDEIRDGGPDDPRLALVLVDIDTVVYMKREKSKPMVFLEVAKALITGDRPEIGDVHKLDMR